MQVLGELIDLNRPDRLALPWWHRACLGFISGTSVYVVAVWNDAGRVPDIIVTVFNPQRWKDVYRLIAQERDRPGILARHFQLTSPHNIAVAESATIGNGRIHQINMYIENQKQTSAEDFTADINTAFKGRLSFIFDDMPTMQRGASRTKQQGVATGRITTLIAELGGAPKDHSLLGYTQVKGGWIDVQWKHNLEIWMKSKSIPYDGFDLDRAVLSADTSGRMLRFVFPRLEARSVIVPHDDAPGEAGRICKRITEDGSNLLTATIRRIQAGRQAELIVVCEPPKRGRNDKYEEKLRARLAKEVLRVNIRRGRSATSTIAPRRELERIVSVPEDYEVFVKEHRLKMHAAGRRLAFISRRARLRFHEELLHTIKAELTEYDFDVIESNPDSMRAELVPADVHSKLWAADAGIVLLGKIENRGVARQPKRRKEALPEANAIWINLAHEIGHLQGQGKPILVLVDRAIPDPFAKMPNLAGLGYQEYSAQVNNIGQRNSEEIRSHVRRWIESKVQDEMT